MSGQHQITEQPSGNPLSRTSTLIQEKPLTPTSSHAETQKHLEAPRQSSFLIQLQDIRHAIRMPMAEFFGVALLIIFGAGSACQVVLSTNPNVASSDRGSFLSINLGWAIGIAMGAWVSGGISGGHINPAITIAMATYRGFPWRRVPSYIFAQVLGGVVGAALVYANYIHAIDIFEGGRHVRTQATASLFATYALPYMTQVSCFFSEFLATAVLSMMVLALTDNRNGAPTNGLLPFALFVLFIGLGASLGMETAYALNPARDFGPRLFLAMSGYGKALFNYRSQYWLWAPIIAPVLGAQAGGLLYDTFLYDGDNSPIKWRRASSQECQLAEVV
uniref:Aquaporin-7-1 n=1 Tax=Laccaria bicolor TaxID=29883 RepID=AQP71_LACBI|nr:RecName: Full=Aquaporin-7-1 [Laccaria bicolor]AFJ15559.1 putative aquaporin 5 [Laccaria bicolor]